MQILGVCKTRVLCRNGSDQRGRHDFLGTSGCAPEGKQTKSRIRCVPLGGHASENAQICRFCSETVLNLTKSVVSEIAPQNDDTTRCHFYKQLQVNLTDTYDELNTNRNSQMVFRATLGAKRGMVHFTEFCSESALF